MRQNKTIVIGLCGNSGSGKSTLSTYLAKKGANVIDADSIAHELMKKGGKTYNSIIRSFDGVTADDGEIDRKKLGAIVFSDRERLEMLNKITHSIIAQEIKERIREGLNVIDAPLLFEAGLDSVCSEVWAVYADEEVRIERIMKRDNIKREDAVKRLSNQAPFSQISKRVGFIIDNTTKIDFKKVDFRLETIMNIGYNE